MVAVMPFMSCSNDDDKNESSENLFLGEWTLTQNYTETYQGGEKVSTENYEVNESDYQTYVFNSDGTFVYTENYTGEAALDSDEYPGTYSYTSNSIVTMIYEYEDEGNIEYETIDWSYSFEGDQLILKEEEEYETQDGAFKDIYFEIYTKN
jgi:hypothetical protein